MSSNISKARLRKAFDEGRRSATGEAQNPYENPKLQKLWELGRTKQRAGELKTPIPPLEHGERRAERVHHNPPGSARAARPAPRRPSGGSPFGGNRSGGPRPGGPRPGGPRPGGPSSGPRDRGYPRR